MTVKTTILTAAIVAALAGVVAAEELNPVVGRVGDFVLRETDVERLAGYQSPEAQQKLQADPEQRAAIVRQLLLSKAVAGKARKDGFDRKPEIKEQVSYIVDNFLAQEYLRKVVTANVAVPDEEAKKYYEEHKTDFVIPPSAKVRHIFFQVPEGSAADVKEKAKAKAEKALERLKNGEDFAKVAAETSEDTESGAKGGDIGTIAPGKTNSEEFEKVAFSLKPGETSPVIETPFGYHIVKVDERKEKRTAPFEEAREYIQGVLKSQLEQKKAQEFLDKVSKESGIEVAGAAPAEPKVKEPAKK